MSRAAHSRPFVSHPDDVDRAFVAVQIPGGAYVVQAAAYNDIDGWNTGPPIEVLGSTRVIELVGATFWQPDVMEPSIGFDDEGRLWMLAAGNLGAHLMARSSASLQAFSDWSQNPARPFPTTKIRFPRFYRLWGKLFLSCEVLLKNDGGLPGDWGWGLARWSVGNQSWTPIGGTTGTSSLIPCFVWIAEGGGASSTQWRVLSMCEGPGQDQIRVAWTFQRSTDTGDGYASEVHFAQSNDLGNNWSLGNDTAITALPITTATGTAVATDTNNGFLRFVSVSTKASGDPVICTNRRLNSIKCVLIKTAGVWSVTSLGAIRGTTPNKGFVGGTADSLLLPNDTGHYLSTDAANAYTLEAAWSFIDETADQMGASINYSLDEPFLAKTGWIRWSSLRSVSDGGSGEVVVSEANPFGAPDYRSSVDVPARLGYGSPLEIWGTLS